MLGVTPFGLTYTLPPINKEVNLFPCIFLFWTCSFINIYKIAQNLKLILILKHSHIFSVLQSSVLMSFLLVL